VTSEALDQIIELIKQWSDMASLSTDNFDLKALRSAMTTTQIPAPDSIEIEEVDIGGISALTDLALTGKSIESRSEIDPIIRNTALLPGIAELYLSGTDSRTPLASPLYGDFIGFPPLLMQVGNHEVLLDDSTRLAEKAESAGVDVKLEVEPEMFHNFQNFAPFLPKAQQAIDRIGEYVRSF